MDDGRPRTGGTDRTAEQHSTVPSPDAQHCAVLSGAAPPAARLSGDCHPSGAAIGTHRPCLWPGRAGEGADAAVLQTDKHLHHKPTELSIRKQNVACL